MKRPVVAFALVIVASWVGQIFIANHAADQAAEVVYQNQLEGCARGNLTIRDPLHTYAAIKLVDDSVTYDERLALRELMDKTAQVNCAETIDRP